LKNLPLDLSGFISLEKLILEYNKFDNNSIFVSIASITTLRLLDLSHNFLSVLPREACDFRGFK
jgi:Leucine-rich repeat (LRR) protein